MDTPFIKHVLLNIIYSTFYDGNDHFNGGHTQFCVTFTVPTSVNSPYTPSAARALAFSARSNNTPATFIQLGDSGCMNLFLQLDKVEPQMGIPNNDFVGQILVQRGELICQNQASLVSLPGSALNSVDVVRAPFPTTIAVALVGDTDVELMGPHKEGDVASEAVRSRRITIVHLSFVSALLDHTNCTVVDVWQIAHPMHVAHRW